MTRHVLTSRDWFGKAAAATLLGAALSFAITAIVGVIFPAGERYSSAQGQLAMWLVAPIWCTILGLCFLFRSGRRAWGWLALANVVAWSVFAALHLGLR